MAETLAAFHSQERLPTNGWLPWAAEGLPHVSELGGGGPWGTKDAQLCNVSQITIPHCAKITEGLRSLLGRREALFVDPGEQWRGRQGTHVETLRGSQQGLQGVQSLALLLMGTQSPRARQACLRGERSLNRGGNTGLFRLPDVCWGRGAVKERSRWSLEIERWPNSFAKMLCHCLLRHFCYGDRW